MSPLYSICVVGLGYVGLPLAVEFGKTQHPTYGYDISSKKIESLKKGIDLNKELTAEEMASTKVDFSNDPSIIAKARVIIAAIPTPIDQAKRPDLEPVKSASKTIGEHLKKDSIVVYESTVYPGVTEDVCVPILEQYSGLKFGKDFQVGYSPERINPGDREHTLRKIKKIVSGSDRKTLKILCELYGEIVDAGIHPASSIKVAEAAKVIENIQRDLNIGLVNELSMIFKRMGIDTLEVLNAAGTKWNFHPYRPGLVGGHCIGVDPYYLTHKAEEIGFHPQIILAGRRVNDSMAEYMVNLLIQEWVKSGQSLKAGKVLILGLSFKEEVADMRNSKAQEIIDCLRGYHLQVEAYDPIFDKNDIEKNFGVRSITNPPSTASYDAMILFSPHEVILKELPTILSWGKRPLLFFDVKGKARQTISSLADSVFYQTL